MMNVPSVTKSKVLPVTKADLPLAATTNVLSMTKADVPSTMTSHIRCAAMAPDKTTTTTTTTTTQMMAELPDDPIVFSPDAGRTMWDQRLTTATMTMTMLTTAKLTTAKSTKTANSFSTHSMLAELPKDPESFRKIQDEQCGISA
jgi:hypothetical protein